MEDSQLTRMAIDEIVRELGERKQQEDQLHERKLNPLGKPNKRFLGRTLSSVLTHNKRNNDRTQANCRRKLEELDDRLRRGVLNRVDVEERDKAERTQHARKSSEFVHRAVSRSTSASALRSSSSESFSSEEETRSRKRKKSKKYKKKGRGKEKGKKKRKIKKGKKRSERRVKNRSRSRTRSRSRSRSRSERASRARKSEKKSKVPDEEFDEYATADDLNYYESVLDGHIGTTMFDNATLHSVYTQQVQQLLCYQAMLADIQARTANAAALTDDVAEAIKTEFEDQGSGRISSASSSLSMSSDLAEGEEVENGVLTINLSSDESASDSSAGSKRKKRKRRPRAPDSCSSSATFDLRSNSSKLSHESEGGATTPCICLDSDSKDSANNEGSNKSGVHGNCLDSESEDSVSDSDHPRCMLSPSNAALLAYSSSLGMDTIEAGLRIVQEPHTLIDLTDE